MTKIIEKIKARRKNRLREEQKAKLSAATTGDGVTLGQNDNGMKLPNGWYYSFEFFPPKTESGLDNLMTRIDRMASRLDPIFIDVTWGESGSTSARSMAVAVHAQRYCGVDVLLHLTCTGVTREQIAAYLRQARSHGIHNILALRGDPPRGTRGWEKGTVSGGECDRAIDLIKLIRALHGSYFCIACAGHPEGHPASYSIEEEMFHLKQKLESGADFIITQFFYSAEVFMNYVKQCRQIGITCPIIPGILPIQSYRSFTRLTDFCNITVPTEILDRLHPVQDDDEAVKMIGCEIASEMIHRILTTPAEDGGSDGVHFYTLNLERSVTRILTDMQVIRPRFDTSIGRERSSSINLSTIHVSSSNKQLPWRPSAMESRLKEGVRPINWANRPKSYVRRTEDWDEYPNGRWGDASSPAFGELSDIAHFYSFTLGSDEDRLAMLGSCPTSHEDVYEVFAKYVEGKLPHLPWCENSLQGETFIIQQQLAALNRAGFLTVNSQPSVNGISSSHPVHGWGGPGGFVYQKSYCECFVGPDNAQKLVSMVESNDSMNLYAVNIHGQELRVGVEEGGVTALTWGVFPNREILQPTIFDPNTFLIWAEEAFSLWTNMWLNLYDVDTQSYELIENIRDTFYLVAIIDNDYVSHSENGNLFECLLRVGGVE